jgi:serine/threonine protein phosphatase PrpC
VADTSGRPLVQVVGRSVLGASHGRANLPNQDAYECIPESGQGENVAVAVADGHGSSRSFRSDRGARLAVRTATRLLRSRLQELTKSHPDHAHAQLRALARAIVEAWVEQVRDDLERYPFSEDDLAKLDQRARRELDGNPLLAYGATLLAAAVTRKGIYYLQVGDGDIMLVARDGTTWLPLPPDRRLVGNETTSLCLPEAWRDFRVGTDTLEQAPRLILLSTDGYANSFKSEAAFRQVGADLLPMIERHGLSFVEQSLEQWLRETTERGAGDDVTLTVASLTLPAGKGRATAPPGTEPPAPAPAPPSVPTTVDDRPPVGVPSHEPAQYWPAATSTVSGYAHRREPPPERRRPERSYGQLLLVAGVLLVAAALAFMLLRQGKPAESPETTKQAPPTVTQQQPGRGSLVLTEFDGREWAIEQGGTVLVRDAGAGGRWTLLPGAGAGWEGFLVEDGRLYAVGDQGRVLLARPREVSSRAPTTPTGPG